MAKLTDKIVLGGDRRLPKYQYLTYNCGFDMKNISLTELQNFRVNSTPILHGLLLSPIAALIAAAPAEASILQSWQFEARGNQLSFITSGGVQPKAELIVDPVRLVIDLPGTTLGNISERQYPGGGIREIRVGQPDSQTARIVVELTRGYTLDPQQIKFKAISPSQWTVNLPAPQPISRSRPPDRQTAPESYRPRESAISSLVPAINETLLEGIEVGDRGIILRTSGQTPEIDVKRPADGTWMSVDLPNTSLSPNLTRRNQVINRFGIYRLQAVQLPSSPPVTRIILSTDKSRADFKVRASNFGGVLIWPEGGVPPAIDSSAIATIESVELRNNSELVVTADRPLSYSSGWDRRTASYRITMPSAQLAQRLDLPRSRRGSPVLSVRERQVAPDAVSLLVQPAARVRVLGVRRLSDRQLSLRLQRDGAVPPVEKDPPFGPPNHGRPPTETEPQIEPPPINNGRLRVVIDPGHGGSDAGAIGIGGLREKEINLSISREVEQILERNNIQVVMTRRNDRDVELEPRTVLANRVSADLFVSIHSNSVDGYRPEVNGVETYYYQSGRRLAEYIQGSILESFDTRNRGVRQARFYVLRHTRMPAVLVEVGFLSGRHDARILSNPTQRRRMAQAIARGIIRYVRGNS